MVQNTDLTFFTNEPERDLYSRFSKILKSKGITLSADEVQKLYEILKNIVED